MWANKLGALDSTVVIFVGVINAHIMVLDSAGDDLPAIILVILEDSEDGGWR